MDSAVTNQRYINECLKIVPTSLSQDTNFRRNKFLNLSKITIPNNVSRILNIGLNFLPSDDRTIRRIIIDFIKIQPTISNSDIIEIMKKRLLRRRHTNLLKNDCYEFAKFIEENENKIIITKPDKTNTLVIMDIDNYRIMGNDIIERHNFIRIDNSLIEETYKELRELQFNTIKKFNEELDLDSKNKINIDGHLNFRYMYLLPKIHKPLEKWINNETPPGRPIVSCFKSMFRTLELFISKFLNPLTLKSAHWIRSSHDLIVSLDRMNLICNNYELYTADINELYPNINIPILIDKCNGFLGRHGISDALTYTEAINTDLCNTYFLFNNQLLKLNKGILMGAPFSPSLAYIYLHEFDDQIMQDPNTIFYARYIDDIFMIRIKGSEFPINLLNPYQLTIGDTESGQMVTFLDTKIWIDQKNFKICYGTFFKPTNNFSYIHWRSEHQDSTKKGLVISQLLRINRTNSIKKFKIIFNEMILRKFHLLGYGAEMLRKIHKKTQLIIETATCKKPKPSRTWQHIITHRNFNNIMRDIRKIRFDEKDGIPNISYYNSKNINCHLGRTNPSKLAIEERGKYYKDPFYDEFRQFDNPNKMRNYRPRMDNLKRPKTSLTMNEAERLKTIINTLDHFNIQIPRKSLFKLNQKDRLNAENIVSNEDENNQN